MSRENMELTQRAIDAWNADGVEGAVRFAPEDVLWHPFPEWIEAAEYRGHQGIREVVGVWTDNFDEYTLHAEELRDFGEVVVVLGEQRGRMKGSGTLLTQPLGWVATDFRDGRIGEAFFFVTWDEALRAAERLG
jgi:ketosteroid isomerase-like protein